MDISRGRCLLNRYLDERGWSQAELARRTGISKRMISYYCNDEKLMSPEAMYKITRALGLKNMEDLYVWVVE